MRRSLVLAAVLAIAPHAHAGNEISAQEADKRFQEGVELFKHREYQASYVKFVEACAAHRTPDCPKSLAMAEMRLDRPADAATHFREYFKTPKFAHDPSASDLRKYYDTVLAKVGLLRIQARDGATVKVDGEAVGVAPLADLVFTSAGSHRVTATYDERTEDRTVSVSPQQTVDVDARAPSSATPVPTTTSTGIGTPPPSGDHEVERRPGAGYGVPIALGVIGLAAVGVGIGFAADQGTQSTYLSSTAPGVCNDLTSAGCMARQQAIDSLRRDDIATVALFIGGGVALAAAIVSWIIWPKSRVMVHATAGGGGLSLSF